MIDEIKSDPLTKELLHTFKGSRVASINGIKANLTVADLTDDLDEIYKVDNSKKAKAQREQWRQNQLYVDTMLKQKHLKD